MTPRMCVRWTIGDVLPYGIEALRLSVWGAYRSFGASARYVIGVHGIAPSHARAVTLVMAGSLPDVITWERVDLSRLPRWLRGTGLSPRLAPRFAPVLVDAPVDDRAELRLDRRCVLFALPPTLAAWLDDPNPRACALLADQDGEPSAALRGAGRGFDLEEALREALRQTPRPLRSREDAERLEVDALSLLEPPRLVSAREIGASDLGSHGVRLSPPMEASGGSDERARQRWERALTELRTRLDVPRPPRARESLAS
jgi:hypothetical protein